MYSPYDAGTKYAFYHGLIVYGKQPKNACNPAHLSESSPLFYEKQHFYLTETEGASVLKGDPDYEIRLFRRRSQGVCHYFPAYASPLDQLSGQ
jgi:hypothetical protein